MAEILVLFAHPKLERSRINKRLIDRMKNRDGITFHDLYERYPDFNIDVLIEKSLLDSHDIIVWHHPFYWYSCPPLLKQWIDVVLEYNWAYGPEGNALRGKKAITVMTAGGTREVYCSEGNNNYSVNEFLRPFEQTARLCGMEYLPPFCVMGTNQLSESDIQHYENQFDNLIELLQDGISFQTIGRCDMINDIPQMQTLSSNER